MSINKKLTILLHYDLSFIYFVSLFKFLAYIGFILEFWGIDFVLLNVFVLALYLPFCCNQILHSIEQPI